jgi:hypothetical protein
MPGAEGNSPSFSDCDGDLELFGVTAEVRQVISPRNSGKQPRSGLHPISQRRLTGGTVPRLPGSGVGRRPHRGRDIGSLPAIYLYHFVYRAMYAHWG